MQMILEDATSILVFFLVGLYLCKEDEATASEISESSSSLFQAVVRNSTPFVCSQQICSFCNTWLNIALNHNHIVVGKLLIFG